MAVHLAVGMPSVLCWRFGACGAYRIDSQPGSVSAGFNGQISLWCFGNDRHDLVELVGRGFCDALSGWFGQFCGFPPAIAPEALAQLGLARNDCVHVACREWNQYWDWVYLSRHYECLS